MRSPSPRRVETALARVVGVPTLEAGARARCDLQGGPERPARRASLHQPTWPGQRLRRPRRHGRDERIRARRPARIRAATAPGSPPARRHAGTVSSTSTGRAARRSTTRASAGSSRSTSATSRRSAAAQYYNGVTPGTNPNTLKDMQGEYLVTGYPGPAFPAVTRAADRRHAGRRAVRQQHFVRRPPVRRHVPGRRSRPPGRLRRHRHGDPRLRDRAAGRDHAAVDHAARPYDGPTIDGDAQRRVLEHGHALPSWATLRQPRSASPSSTSCPTPRSPRQPPATCPRRLDPERLRAGAATARTCR